MRPHKLKLPRHSRLPSRAVEWGNGAERASNDADVSIAPSEIPYGGFSPIRLRTCGAVSVEADRSSGYQNRAAPVP